MPTPELGEFAKLLVQEVRDRAIHACDIKLLPHGKGPEAERWKKLDTKAGIETVGNTMIPDIVDETIF